MRDRAPEALIESTRLPVPEGVPQPGNGPDSSPAAEYPVGSSNPPKEYEPLRLCIYTTIGLISWLITPAVTVPSSAPSASPGIPGPVAAVSLRAAAISLIQIGDCTSGRGGTRRRHLDGLAFGGLTRRLRKGSCLAKRRGTTTRGSPCSWSVMTQPSRGVRLLR